MPSSEPTNTRFPDSKLNPKEDLTPNPWLCGGPIGSRDTVLVFKTSVLTVQSLDSESCSSGTNNDSDYSILSKPSTTILAPINKNINFQPSCRSNVEHSDDVVIGKNNEIISKKRSIIIDSMSSSLSDQSISSVNGDTDIEDAILKLSDYNSSSSDASPQLDEANEIVPSDTRLDDKENTIMELIDKSEMPGAVLRMTYRFVQTETRLLKKILIGHGLTEASEDQHYNLLWTGVHIKADILRNLAPYQRVNHFPRSYELTRKDRLHKNIEKMQHLRGFKHFDIVPQSFILPTEYKDLVSAHNKYRGPWIVKPVASSRGRGIFIVNSPDQIPPDEHVLVAKYIAEPLCIDGHKCDIRLYVAITSYDPLIIYVYEEGLVRLATVKYNRNTENLWNPCMHLCNYSINKYHSDYIKSNDPGEEDVGHKWTLSALLRHLKSQGCDVDQLMLNIEDVIIKAIMACTQPIVSACRMFVPTGNNCFELYGLDILIDDALKPWLLEINLSPSLGIDTPLDAKVKSGLLTDLLTLIGIPALNPLSKAEYDAKFNRRNSNRRTNSAEFINATPVKKPCNFSSLTAEENRIVKSAKAQYSRRGGFTRVYPTHDSIQRYGAFLDSTTGIPTSTLSATGSVSCPMIIPHNYNLMLHSHLYPNGASEESRFEDRMLQYERPLEHNQPLFFGPKNNPPKCSDEARRLRKQIRRLIENGSELSQLQSRKAFGNYLECILKRISIEPRSHHEKLILKFIQRAGVNLRAPNFVKDPYNHRILSKDRGAMVAKQLADYLTIYNRETDAYVDTFDNFGMISIKLFDEFLAQAQESDLESVLTLHTNFTKHMPFLYNRCGVSVPPTPPIPTGSYGFLKALPSMAPGGILRDDARIETYYKSIENRPYNKEDEKSDKLLEKPGKLNPIKKKMAGKKF